MSRNIKEIGKELMGKSLNSYHRKTGLTQLEKNNEMQDGILNGILSQVDDAYIEKTEQSNVINLDGSGDGVVVLDSIEGNTLVNLGMSENFNQYNMIMDGCKFTRVLHSNKRYGQLIIPMDKLSLFKSGGKYKIITNITKNTLVNSDEGSQNAFQLFTYNYSNHAIESSTQGHYSLNYDCGEIGIKECVVTMKDFNNPSNPITQGVMHFSSSYYAISGELEGYIIICEYNEDIVYPTTPFNGLQSSFEEQVEDDKYKIEILSRCSNIIKTISDAHQIKPIYSFYMGELDKIKPYLKHFNLVDSYKNCNNLYDYYYTDDNINIWMNLGERDKDKALEILNNKIAEGLNKSNKIKLLLNEPLRSVPNGVKDKLCIKNKKLVIERNTLQLLINGTEDFHLSKDNSYNSDYHWFAFRLPSECKIVDNAGISKVLISDKFNVLSNTSTDFSKDEEFITLVTGNKSLYFNVKKANYPALQDFKNYLSNNNVNIVIEITEPIYEEVLNEYGEPILLEGYENGTLYIDSTIVPTTTVRYTPKMESLNTLKEVSNNNVMLTTDINDTIIPYMMEVDLMIMEKEMSLFNSLNKNIRTMEVLDMTSMQKRTGEMLERLIKGKTLTEKECKTRVTVYLNAGKITDEQAEELMLLISEIYA